MREGGKGRGGVHPPAHAHLVLAAPPRALPHPLPATDAALRGLGLVELGDARRAVDARLYEHLVCDDAKNATSDQN